MNFKRELLYLQVKPRKSSILGRVPSQRREKNYKRSPTVGCPSHALFLGLDILSPLLRFPPSRSRVSLVLGSPLYLFFFVRNVALGFVQVRRRSRKEQKLCNKNMLSMKKISFLLCNVWLDLRPRQRKKLSILNPFFC